MFIRDWVVDAPEVAALMRVFDERTAEIKESVQPVLERLRTDPRATEEGVSYLTTKLHLLLSYTTCVAFYLMVRAEEGAAKAETHPVVSELVRLRAVMERMRPLDARMKREIDSLLASAAADAQDDEDEGAEEEEDDDDVDDADADEEDRRASKKATSTKKKNPLAFRPSLADLGGDNGDEDDDDDDANGGGSGKEYRAPKVAPQSMEDKRAARQKRIAMERARNSDLVRELRDELTGAPEEVREGSAAAAVRASDLRAEEERRAYEEANFMRLPETKDDKARRKRMEMAKSAQGGGGGGSMAEDLKAVTDERGLRGVGGLAGLVGSAGGDNDDEADEAARAALRPISHFVNEMEMARRGKRSLRASGDQDVMPRDRTRTLNPRRSLADDDDDGGGAGGEERPSRGNVRVPRDRDDAGYVEMSEKKRRAREERKDAYSFPKRFAPEPTPIVDEDESRAAGDTIVKNRGLRQHRSKESRNSRVRLRAKYDEKVKARRGQVRDLRVGEGDAYGGEKSGVRSQLVRSRVVKV